MKKWFLPVILAIFGVLFWGGCNREPAVPDKIPATVTVIKEVPAKAATSSKPAETAVEKTTAEPSQTPTPAISTQVITKGKAPVKIEGERKKPPKGAQDPSILSKNEIKFLQGGKVLYSLKGKPKIEDFVEDKTLKFPEQTMVVALSIGRTDDAPEGIDLDVKWYNNELIKPIFEGQKFNSGQLAKQDMMFLLSPADGNPIPSGPYRVEVVEKESGKKLIRAFDILGASTDKDKTPTKQGVQK